MGARKFTTAPSRLVPAGVSPLPAQTKSASVRNPGNCLSAATMRCKHAGLIPDSCVRPKQFQMPAYSAEPFHTIDPTSCTSAGDHRPLSNSSTARPQPGIQGISDGPNPTHMQRLAPQECGPSPRHSSGRIPAHLVDDVNAARRATSSSRFSTRTKVALGSLVLAAMAQRTLACSHATCT